MNTPARRDKVLAAVLLMLEEAPDALWVDLFEAIPNHYASARSMYDSLRSRHPRLACVGFDRVDRRRRGTREAGWKP